MISKHNMRDGQWYVGFVFLHGRQAGVDTMCWSDGADAFLDRDDDLFKHYEDTEGWKQHMVFEPASLDVNPLETKEYSK